MKNIAEKIFKGLLVAAILALPLYLIRFKIGPLPSTLLEVLIIATTIAALATGQFRKIKNRRALLLGGAFAAAGLIAALFDPDKIRGLGLWKAYFLDGFLLFAAVLSVVEGKTRDWLMRALIGTGVIAALGALYFFYVHNISDESGRLLDLDRLSPNYLAMFLAPILAVVLALIRLRIGTAKNYFYLAAAGLVLMVALILTNSRGALLSLAVVLLVIIFDISAQGRFRRPAKIAFWSLMVLMLLGAAWYFRPDWQNHERKATSSNVRYYIWQTSLTIAGQRPIFGVGLGNYQDYFWELTKNRVNFPEYIAPQALTAHDLYLHLYVTGGILLLVTFLGLIWGTHFWQPKNLAAAAALTAILVFGLVDTPFFRNDLSGLFWVVVAMLYLNNSKIKNQNAK